MATEKTAPDITVTFQRLSDDGRITDYVNLGNGSPKEIEIDFFLGNESLLGTAHVTLDEVLAAIKLLRSR